MKKYIITAFLSLIISLTIFAAPSFVTLEADKDIYQVGDRALLMAHVRITPTNSNFELFFKSRFNSAALTIDTISNEEAVAFSPVLDTVGEFEWQVKVYMQDRVVYQSLQISRTKLIQDNAVITDELANETDLEVRAFLIQMREQNSELITEINSEINQNRRHLQTVRLNIQVEAKSEIFKAVDLDPITFLNVELDRANATYTVGERATFVVSRLMDIEGRHGEFEYLVRARLNNQKIGIELTENSYVVNGETFIFEESFTGEKELKVILLVRAKSHAENLRIGIEAASRKRLEYIRLKNAYANDPVRVNFYQMKISRMNSVIKNYYLVLESSLSLIDTFETVIFIN